MSYNDIDSGKVLNKEGLLALCNQIKTEIANNSGGGGGSGGNSNPAPLPLQAAFMTSDNPSYSPFYISSV